MKILVTGANGFVARKLYNFLVDRGYDVIGTTRKLVTDPKYSIALGNISSKTDWSTALLGCNTVIHTAGRAHVLNDSAIDKLKEFRKVNRDATFKLAKDAIKANIKHFIFISSIGVNGSTTNGVAFSENDEPKPTSEYAVSKFEAEKGLRCIAQNSGMAITIIRPALICGNSAPGNINRLVKLVAKGYPLPFKNANNIRAMASLENVISFIGECIKNEKSQGETFLIADKEKLTMHEIVSLISEGLDKKNRQFYLPEGMMKSALTILGKKNVYEQLYGNLDVDSSKSQRLLEWTPPVRLSDTLKSTAAFFSREKKE